MIWKSIREFQKYLQSYNIQDGTIQFKNEMVHYSLLLFLPTYLIFLAHTWNKIHSEHIGY